MSKEILKRHLETLHKELSETKTVDAESAKLLKTVMVDVKTLLAHKGSEPSDDHGSIKERLEDSSRHFDVSHPSLAATIRTVVHTLNTMGI